MDVTALNQFFDCFALIGQFLHGGVELFAAKLVELNAFNDLNRLAIGAAREGDDKAFGCIITAVGTEAHAECVADCGWCG